MPAQPDGMRDDAQPPPNGSARAKRTPRHTNSNVCALSCRSSQARPRPSSSARLPSQTSTPPSSRGSSWPRTTGSLATRTSSGCRPSPATTTEPLVGRQVPPELRDRLAVYSVTDAADAPPPIPVQRSGPALPPSSSYTTVSIDRVEEPFAWTNAVASGRISDDRDHRPRRRRHRHPALNRRRATASRHLQRRTLPQSRRPTDPPHVGVRRGRLLHSDPGEVTCPATDLRVQPAVPADRRRARRQPRPRAVTDSAFGSIAGFFSRREQRHHVALGTDQRSHHPRPAFAETHRGR